MKVTKVKVDKTEKGEIPAFVQEVNECADTWCELREGYYYDTLTIVAVGKLAMEYTLRKVECTFNDYEVIEVRG